MPAIARIALADGRQLAVWTYGRESAHPVLYFHGTPSSHVEWEVFGDDSQLDRHNLRIVAPDRPGMGASTFLPGRRLGDWSADAASMVAALGLERFSVLGYSGGGAYAVATALAMPTRVTSLALVAPVVHDSPAMIEGLDPNGLRIKEMARTKPRLPARFLPSFLAGQMRKTLPPADNAAMARYLAAALGAADVRILREGHISIFTRHVGDILKALAPA